MFVTLVVASGVLVGSAFAVAGSSKPDMVALLPTDTGHIAPIYVDTYTRPGKVLYRFSAVLKNLGGAMDLYMDPNSGAAMQVLWPNGNPTVKPDPNKVPNAAGIVKENRSQQVGAFFIFNPSQGHNHWHFQKAAYYALLLPGGGVRSADKVGLLHVGQLGDGRRRLDQVLPGRLQGLRADDVVRAQEPAGDLHADGHLAELRRPVRRAVDRPVGRYQGPDAGELPDPGDGQPQRVHRRVEPEQQHGDGHPDDPRHDRRPGSKNVGARAATTLRDHRQGGRARRAGPQQPRRRPGRLPDVRKDLGCYLFASANGPLTFSIGAKPKHGSLTIVSQSGTTASVRYTPQAGFTGADSFTFTVVDKRKLAEHARHGHGQGGVALPSRGPCGRPSLDPAPP